MSCSAGVAATLSVLDAVTVTVPPVANAFGTAPQPYAVKQSVLTFNSSTGLLLGSLVVSTGLINDTASSTYTGAVSTLLATATSTVNDLNIALGIPAIQVFGITTPAISTLNITAKTLTSTSTASKTNGGRLLVVAGSSAIEGLTISGAGFDALTFNTSALAVTKVNDYLVDILGLRITSNYQSPIYLDGGSDQIGIQTAALAIQFNDFAFNGGLLNGTVLIADSAASVPELASWTMMLIGFGMVGAFARQRQSLALA